MNAADAKKPPEGGSEEVARIELALMANGGVRMVGTLGGRPNCSYATLRARDVPIEVAILLGELRSEAAAQRLGVTAAGCPTAAQKPVSPLMRNEKGELYIQTSAAGCRGACAV